MGRTHPLVSIVVPFKNPGRMFERCLESVYAQTHRPIELVLVDSNSDDGSLLRAQAFARENPFVRVVACAEPGASCARNTGYSQVTGSYVQWLDADDQLAPDKIALQVAALEARPESDGAYGDWRWRFFQEGELQQEVVAIEEQHDDLLLELLVDHWRTAHSYLLRRSLADRAQALEGWSNVGTLCLDREYFTTAALAGGRFVYVPGSSADYNMWGATQLTRSQTPRTRAIALKEMFARLRERAAAVSTPLTSVHQSILGQSWDLLGLKGSPIDTTALGVEEACVVHAIKRYRTGTPEQHLHYLINTFLHARSRLGEAAPTVRSPARLSELIPSDTQAFLAMDPRDFAAPWTPRGKAPLSSAALLLRWRDLVFAALDRLEAAGIVERESV